MSFIFAGRAYGTVDACAWAVVERWLTDGGCNDLGTQRAILARWTDEGILNQILAAALLRDGTGGFNTCLPDGVGAFQIKDAIGRVRKQVRPTVAHAVALSKWRSFSTPPHVAQPVIVTLEYKSDRWIKLVHWSPDMLADPDYKPVAWMPQPYPFAGEAK
jgi:hypothetical protein